MVALPIAEHLGLWRYNNVMDSGSGFFNPSADLDENGVDLNRLRRNLKLSLEERIERNQREMIKVLEFRRARESSELRPTHQSSEPREG